MYFKYPQRKRISNSEPGRRSGFYRDSVLGQSAAMAQPAATPRARHVVTL
jgi:hypothetical protein